MDYKSEIARMKTDAWESAKALALPVRNTSGDVIGQLVPVGEWLLDEPEKIECFRAWRQAAMSMFLMQFPTSYPRTESFIRDRLIAQDNQLMFAIHDAENRFIGHIGIADVCAESAEIDNLIRGVAGGDPRLVYFAELTLLLWCFEVLAVTYCKVGVLSHNWLVTALHEDVGFTPFASQPLARHEEKGEISHDFVEPEASNVDYHYLTLRFSREAFDQKFGTQPASAAPAISTATDDSEQFHADTAAEVNAQGEDAPLRQRTTEWMVDANRHKYSYHFEWLGRPIIQHPQDIIGLQELLWRTKPDLVIETGVARGGSVIFLASMLELLALCGGPANAQVVGIDIDIRAHNKQAILAHPLAKRIALLQGSSTAASTYNAVRDLCRGRQKILVILDSNHTHAHVLDELNLYAPLVSKDSYCVVFDTIVEDLPPECSKDRPWGKGNNPKTAVHAFLKSLAASPRTGADGAALSFEIDRHIEHKLLITVAPDGFLHRL